MKPTPPDWPRLSAAVFYDDAPKAIDWLCRAFDFEVRVKIEGGPGNIVHCELTYGEALIMIESRQPRVAWQAMFRSPRSIDGVVTQSLALFVDDVDSHVAKARAEGARIVGEPQTNDHGPEYWVDRSYAALDVEGHLWSFIQRISTRGVPA